jgi:LysM repeat protein
MPGRSHARYLAPFAIFAFLVALVIVVSSSGGGVQPSEEAATPIERTEETSGREAEAEDRPRRRSGPRTYRVRAGDTPSAIAERTGVPLEQLQELNPDIDPQQLSPGQRLRLRR